MSANNDDRFNPENLKLSQDFSATQGAKKLITRIPVSRPNRDSWVRTHHNPEDYRLNTAVLELKEENETYLVAPDLHEELSGEIRPVTLYTTISRQGILSLWPVTLPGSDGQWNPWHRSAADAAERAKGEWVRLVANKALGAYDIYVATGNLPDPEWPDMSFRDILRTAFSDRYIDTVDHVIVRRLRGAI
jgi:hypothetical protein